MDGKRASAFSAGFRPAFQSQIDNSTSDLPRAPLIPVNYRKPIFKRSARGRFGRGGFRNKRRAPKNCESRPYPSVHDELNLRGLLVGNQIFLYDRADYRFLRLHRGCFGEFIKQSYRNFDSRSTSDGLVEESEDVFPPPLGTQPVAALNLYEAYFLSVVCDSLEIWDGSTEEAVFVEKSNLMAVFSDIDRIFPQFFAVYYHYRMLKYVVISGVKFGVDMALYQYGPSKTHSVYLVYVIIPDLRDPGIIMLDTLQRIANATKKDGLLVQVTAGHLSEEQICQTYSFSQMKITEVLVRRRERLFDQPVESVPAEMLPAYMQQQMVNEGKLPPYFAPRTGGPFQPRNQLTNPPRPFFGPRAHQGGSFSGRFPPPSSSSPWKGHPAFGTPDFAQSAQGCGEEVMRPPRIRPNAFQMPTVSFGVRRVFRGRSLGVTRGRGADRSLAGGQPVVYRPMFRGLGSWSNRRGDFRVTRPGFGNNYVENVTTTSTGLFDDQARNDKEERKNDETQ